MDDLFLHTLRDISAASSALCKTKPGADEAIELLMLRSDIRVVITDAGFHGRSQASPCGTGSLAARRNYRYVWQEQTER